jgi:alkylhydroperoxidase family enzyme
MLMWSPGMAEPFIDFNDAVRYKISLSDSLRELIILRVGHLCEAAYKIHHHTRISRERHERRADRRAKSRRERTRPRCDPASGAFPHYDLLKERRASDVNLAQAIKVFGESGLNEIIMLVGCYALACMLLHTRAFQAFQATAKFAANDRPRFTISRQSVS